MSTVSGVNISPDVQRAIVEAAKLVPVVGTVLSAMLGPFLAALSAPDAATKHDLAWAEYERALAGSGVTVDQYRQYRLQVADFAAQYEAECRADPRRFLCRKAAWALPERIEAHVERFASLFPKALAPLSTILPIGPATIVSAPAPVALPPKAPTGSTLLPVGLPSLLPTASAAQQYVTRADLALAALRARPSTCPA